MSRRVEVLAGPGLVIRYGEVVAWAGPQASSSLITFLIDGARNLADDPNGGQLLADHLRGVLVNGDPEPAVPFVTIGPSAAGLDVLLHGPVQLWDGIRWHMVSPSPGWLREMLPTVGTLLTGPAGTQPPNLAISSPLNLVAGIVPGGGLAMIPIPTAPPAPPPVAAAPTPAAATASATASATPAAGPMPAGPPGPQVPPFTPGPTPPGPVGPPVGPAPQPQQPEPPPTSHERSPFEPPPPSPEPPPTDHEPAPPQPPDNF
ncbi:MAG TPA: hypothetical protein VLL25_14915 [Acidimicrobiales bacterium]|nr:hypothetical protein [Acidimicrobiales bacterium]